MDCLETQYDRCKEDESVDFFIYDATRVGLFLFLQPPEYRRMVAYRRTSPALMVLVPPQRIRLHTPCPYRPLAFAPLVPRSLVAKQEKAIDEAMAAR